MSSGRMLTCTNCGNQRPEGTRFCANCGTPFVQPDQQPPPIDLGRTRPSARKRRLVGVAAGAVVALLVAGGAVAAAISLTGGGGSDPGPPAGGNSAGFDATDVLPTDDTSTEATGVDCDELTLLVADFSGLDAAGADPIASADDIEEAMEALSEFVSQAPEDVQQDMRVVLDAYGEMLRTVSDLGLEPGDTPDVEQQDEILELLDVFDDAGFLDASLNVAEWLEAATQQCLFPAGTETMEGSDDTGSGNTPFGDETSDAEAFGGEWVEETCDGILVYAAALAEDIPNPKVEDVERLAAMAAALAHSAPAEQAGALAGQPKESLEDTAEGIETLAGLLSVLGLDPDSDAALAEPRIAEVIDRLGETEEVLGDWFETRCSAEDQAALERIRNG